MNKTPIEILTEYQSAKLTWFAACNKDEATKIAAWNRLKIAESANDAQEEAHAQQMRLATRRPQKNDK